MGRVNINWQCTPRVCGTTAYLLSYTYDLAGDLATQSNGVGVTFTYGYNSAPRLTSMTSSLVDSQHPATLLNNIHYGPFGLISDSLGNGLNESIGYSPRGLLNSYSSTPYSFSLPGLAGDGTITAGNDSVNGNWTYTYDQFNRLASSSKSTAPVQGFSYAYDRYGNRWQQNVTTGTGPAPQYLLDNTTNRITGSGITYDALGNVLTDGLGNNYTYDAENRLIKVNNGTTATYTYDADGRRIKNTSTEFLYDLSGRAVTLLDASTGGWNFGEIYAGGRHVGTYSGSTTNFLHSDWLGTKRVMTGITGATSQTCTSLPFGDGLSCTGTEWGFNHFTNDVHDGEDNLEHTWFRQFSTTQGRWMGADPYLGSIDLRNPQSMNRYGYALNVPTALVDPLGLFPMSPCGVANAILGTLVGYGETPCESFSGDGGDGAGTDAGVPLIFKPGGQKGGTPDTKGNENEPACVPPNAMQKAGIALQHFLAQMNGNAVGVGLGGSASYGIGVGNTFTLSRQVFVTPEGDAAFVTTITDPRFLAVPINSIVLGASAYGGFQVSSSDVRDLNALSNGGMDYGVGGGDEFGGGMDVSTSTSSEGEAPLTVTFTIGAAAGGAGKGLVPTFTVVQPICR